MAGGLDRPCIPAGPSLAAVVPARRPDRSWLLFVFGMAVLPGEA